MTRYQRMHADTLSAAQVLTAAALAVSRAADGRSIESFAREHGWSAGYLRNIAAGRSSAMSLPGALRLASLCRLAVWDMIESESTSTPEDLAESDRLAALTSDELRAHVVAGLADALRERRMTWCDLSRATCDRRTLASHLSRGQLSLAKLDQAAAQVGGLRRVLGYALCH